MVTRIGGNRRKTRKKLQKPVRQKGKMSIRRFNQELESGTRVQLNADPSYQKGIYFRRFHGKIGVVSGKKGACYRVLLNDGGKEKMMLVHPVHLRDMEAR